MRPSWPEPRLTHGDEKKKITNSDIIGQQGIALIHQRVSGMGFLWHPTGLEAGIDGSWRSGTTESGEITGPVLAVQSKATTLHVLQPRQAPSFEYLCEENDLDYWLNSNIPVVVVVSRPNQDEAYWACIRIASRTLPPEARKSTSIKTAIASMPTPGRISPSLPSRRIRVSIPRRQSQSASTQTSWGYRGYSSRIFVARTDLRFACRWGCARDITPEPRGNWVLADKTLVSFHDLAEEPWRQLCDAGTCRELRFGRVGLRRG